MKWKRVVMVKWGFDERDGALVIKGKGSLEDYVDGSKRRRMKEYDNPDDIPWRMRYREKIKSIAICYGISSISKHAFNKCLNLKSAVLSNSITDIGMSAFHGCVKLESIVIPSSVSSIEQDSFSKCYCLKAISVTNAVVYP